VARQKNNIIANHTSFAEQ